MLGYTEVSWGQARKPLSARKPWRALTDNEKKAAGLLGYTVNNWNNMLGIEPQPASARKKWAELTLCTEGEDMPVVQRLRTLSVLALALDVECCNLVCRVNLWQLSKPNIRVAICQRGLHCTH